jgi:hypothetical protein
MCLDDECAAQQYISGGIVAWYFANCTVVWINGHAISLAPACEFVPSVLSALIDVVLWALSVHSHVPCWRLASQGSAGEGPWLKLKRLAMSGALAVAAHLFKEMQKVSQAPLCSPVPRPCSRRSLALVLVSATTASRGCTAGRVAWSREPHGWRRRAQDHAGQYVTLRRRE